MSYFNIPIRSKSMALKFKVGDLVKTLVEVGLNYATFPADTEATVKELIPRAGIGYPYIITLTKFGKDVAVMEKEIEFANGPLPKPTTLPTYHKLVSASGTYCVVQDNHGTHYLVLDTNDNNIVPNHKYNKNLFVNFTEDKAYVHTTTRQSMFGGWSVKDLMDDTTLPQGQGNQVQAKPNVCTCGVEKACGPSGRHSAWCDKESKNKVGA